MSAWKIRNSLRTIFVDPRKLIPVAIALIIVALIVWLGNMGLDQPRANLTQITIDPDVFSAIIMLSLILFALSVIDSGLGDGLLAFGMPDVDYLFPSPISRRVVLAYRLPGLMFSALFMAGFLLMTFNVTAHVLHPKFHVIGHSEAPWWASTAALFLAGGVYTNLALLISIRILDRRVMQRILLASTIAIGGGLGLLAWIKGFGAVEAIVQSPVVRWIFLPSSLASESLLDGFSHQPALAPLMWLLMGYVASVIPLFMSRANWYEQSIVSSERVSTVRNAAKAGYSSLMAAKAESYKGTRTKTYTLKPFGQGAYALLWAHLCAAAKKPTANFFGPVCAGVGAGAFAAFAVSANVETQGIGFTAITMIALYCSMGFMATAKTASESAIRRRELLAPLPFPGWQSVAANLGAPFATAFLFFLGCAITYVVMRGPNSLMVAFGFGIALPLRLAARMILQYIVVIAYPDAADKMQQFIAVGVYLLVATPFLIAEFILCIPGLLLHSPWLLLLLVSFFQVPLTAILLFLAGKASETAVATGEPVRIWSLVARRTRSRDTGVAE